MRRAGFVAAVAIVVITSQILDGPEIGPEQARPVARGQAAATSADDDRRLAVLRIEELRAPAVSDVSFLLEMARTASGDTPNAALRALGRLERRSLITDLLPYLGAVQTREEAANALAQSLRGEPLESVPAGQQEQVVLEALVLAGEMALSSSDLGSVRQISRAVGRLPYLDSSQVRSAEAFLVRAFELPAVAGTSHLEGAAEGLESLARRSRKLAALGEAALEALREHARRVGPRRADGDSLRIVRRRAVAALLASQGMDAETLKDVLEDPDAEVRRLAVVALAGAGSVLVDDARVALIRSSLSDPEWIVRYEGVRAWTRRAAGSHGCIPLIEALGDKSLHVVLAAIDALGDQCRDDEVITIRIASEARTPLPMGRWQREAHAFVALAKRAPERASIGLMTFAMHNVWQVRMYAARAAAILDSVGVLARLAADPEDNVAEAALAPLRKRIGDASDDAFIAVLERTRRPIARDARARPYEIIRTAAINLAGARPTPSLIAALAGALERITAEQCETSRDVRLALIERLGELGSVAQARALTPLLKDIDPVVAQAASAVIQSWTRTALPIDPPNRGARGIPSRATLLGNVCATFRMDNGKRFEMAFLSEQAPLARARFVALASERYYDNLTFHRVVPNFVIQGGSPGANEYCGDCPFMRDEVGIASHVRGTVGISTRGRDTGDAQIFVNLVDNLRLDHEYTVFGRVIRPEYLAVIDEIQEGDRIQTVRITPWTPACGAD
jgi:cyclophilin family peptidyl-prolyl cis-trans isomerase/HEAT repeat protein